MPVSDFVIAASGAKRYAKRCAADRDRAGLVFCCEVKRLYPSGGSGSIHKSCAMPKFFFVEWRGLILLKKSLNAAHSVGIWHGVQGRMTPK